LPNQSQPPKHDYVEAHSSGILRVSKRTDPHNLASAIMRTALDKGRIQVRAAGSEALNIAVKAAIIADGKATERGKTFFFKPTFDVVQGDRGSGEVTIIVLSLSLLPIEKVAPLYEHTETSNKSSSV